MTSFFRSVVNVCSNATGSFAPATIPALSSSWVVDPADYQDVDLQVKGNMATGHIRFAGLDDPLVAGSRQVPVHLVVQVDVHVSHESLSPLVKVNTQQDQERRAWNLTLETPGWSELPFGMVTAGINVDILLTFKSGRPSLDEKKQSKGAGEKVADANGGGDFCPFRNLSAHVTNLSHEFASSALAAQSATQPQSPPPVLANADAPPSYFDAVTGDSSTEVLAALQSLQLFTTNGHIRLEPSRAWRVGNSASFKSTNGSIEVSGPLRIVSSSAHDAPPNPFATGSSSSLDAIPANGGVVVNATNGRVLIQVQGSPSVFASSTNGRVTLNADSCGSVAGKSTNGRVDIVTKGATRSVAANSMNGRIGLTAESVSESIEAKCVNGAVAASVVPGPSPRTLLAESTNGSVAVVAGRVLPSARIEGRSTNGKAQVTADMSDQVNTVTLEGSSKTGRVRLEVNAANAGWPARSERAKSNPAGGSKAKLSVVREGTEHQPPQSATVVGASNLAAVEVTLGDTSRIRA